jgi:8-oxo-dGTP diphosphatase
MIPGTDHIGVGIGAIIINEKSKILLTKRGDFAKNEQNKWEFPGGSVNFNETLKETIKREIKEELNIEIEVRDFFGVTEYISLERKQHWIGTDTICKIVKGEIKILEPKKCSEFGWFTIEEIKNLDLAEYSKQTLKNLINYLAMEQPAHHASQGDAGG